MLAIRLDKELEKELDLLAKTRGSNRSAVVREAIIQYLEDNEDIQLAKESLIQNEQHQIAETVEERAWPGQLESATLQSGNCENLIGLFKDAFSTG